VFQSEFVVPSQVTGWAEAQVAKQAAATTATVTLETLDRTKRSAVENIRSSPVRIGVVDDFLA